METRRCLLPLVATAILVLFALVACGQDENRLGSDNGSIPPSSDSNNISSPDFDPEAYYGGNTIRLMTSSNPGGSTDLQMRVLASRMPSYIPGNPRIIASNVPPHIVGKNYIYQAKPDGLILGLFSTSMLREERSPGAVYDSSRLTYVADLGDSNYVLTIRGDMPYQSIQEMMGSSGPTLRTVTPVDDAASVDPLLMGNMLIADFLDIPFEVASLSERGSEVVLSALEQDEANWYSWGGSHWRDLPTARPNWLTEGYLVPILGWTSGGHYTPNAEVLEMTFPHLDQFLTDEQRQMFTGLVHASLNQVRPLVMPPDVPEGPREALREAFRTAFHDEEFCADWEGLTGSACEWTEGEIADQRATAARAAAAEWGDRYDSIAAELFARYARKQ